MTRETDMDRVRLSVRDVVGITAVIAGLWAPLFAIMVRMYERMAVLETKVDAMQSALRAAGKVAGLCLALALAAGCSATAEIAKGANSVRADAQESRDVLAPYIAAGEPAPTDALERVDALQSSIIARSDEITRALPGVVDVTPWWANLMLWLAVAACALALVYVGFRTHAFAAIGALVRRAVALIPRRNRTRRASDGVA